MVGLGEEGGEWWLVHRNSCTSSAALWLRFLSGEPSCRLVGCFGCALLGIFCRSLGRRAALFSDFVESSIWECWRCRGPSPVRPPWAVQRRGRQAGPAEQPSGSSAQRSRACFPGMGPSFQGLSGRNGLSSSSLWGFAQGWPGGGGTGERVSRGLGPLGVSPEHAVLGAGLQGPGLSSPLAETGWLSPCPASRRDCFSESQRL